MDIFSGRCVSNRIVEPIHGEEGREREGGNARRTCFSDIYQLTHSIGPRQNRIEFIHVSRHGPDLAFVALSS